MRYNKWFAVPIIIAAVAGSQAAASAATSPAVPTRVAASCSAYPGTNLATGTPTGTGYFEQCDIGSISAYIGGGGEVYTGPVVNGPATATLRITSAKREVAAYISGNSTDNGQPPITWTDRMIPMTSYIKVPAGQSEQVVYGLQAPITKAQYQLYLKKGTLPVRVVLIIR